MRTGVPFALISQTSVVALGAGELGVALADAVGAPGPNCPTGRVTRIWPAGVQAALRMVPESPSRLS